MSNDDVIEGEVIEGSGLTTISSSELALIDRQIATAQKYPRNLTNFKREALEYATIDEETAASMFYVIPRGGKSIEGPGVRLAEVVGSCWGNLRYASRIIETTDKFAVAQGTCQDLQRNVACSVEVRTRLTDKYGKSYNDDMTQVACAAACSKALREAIFKVVPRAFVNSIYQEAKKVSLGKADSMAEKRGKMLAWYAKLGVSESQVLSVILCKGVEDIGIDELITLKGMATAIKDGEATIETIFNRQAETGGKVAKSDVLEKAASRKKPAGKVADVIIVDEQVSPVADKAGMDAHKAQNAKIKAEIARATHVDQLLEINEKYMRNDVEEWCNQRAEEIRAEEGEV